MSLRKAAASALAALNRSGRPYALCGGLAYGLFAPKPRATGDIDVVIASEDDLPAIDAALLPEGWGSYSAAMDFPGGYRLHRRLRLVDGATAVLEMLVAPPGVDLLAGRLTSELAGVTISLISKDNLIRMKRAADRPQDRADVAALEAMT